MKPFSTMTAGDRNRDGSGAAATARRRASRHCSCVGHWASGRSTPATIWPNWWWSSVQIRIVPACVRCASAQSRASGVKSRLLRVTTTRCCSAASSSTSGSSSPSRLASSASASTSWPAARSGVPIRRGDRFASNSRCTRCYHPNCTNGYSSRHSSTDLVNCSHAAWASHKDGAAVHGEHAPRGERLGHAAQVGTHCELRRVWGGQHGAQQARVEAISTRALRLSQTRK